MLYCNSKGNKYCKKKSRALVYIALRGEKDLISLDKQNINWQKSNSKPFVKFKKKKLKNKLTNKNKISSHSKLSTLVWSANC